MPYERSWRISIRAPRDAVFQYLVDVSRHVEWGSDMTKSAAREGGPPAVGSRYDTEGMLNGKLNNSTVTITALDAPKRLAFDAEDSNSVFHHEFLFTPSGDGTLVERHVGMTKGPFYFPLVLTIFKSTVQKNYNGAMENLKAKMNSGG